MTDRELMQQALEALDYEAEKSYDADAWLDIRKALREMLAQPEQEHIQTLEDAVAAERERCAQICDHVAANAVLGTAGECARAIRNATKQQED